MTIEPGLAAELRRLTRGLDLPGPDVVEALSRLDADARAAVNSYLGLTLTITAAGAPFVLTVLDAGTAPGDIRTSLLIPLPVNVGSADASAVALIVYAATPGAFVDLAADLSWVTGRAPEEFCLDEHLHLPVAPGEPSGPRTMGDVDQAVGLLIGRGATPELALGQLQELADSIDTDLQGAAAKLLAPPHPSDRDHVRP